MKRFNLVTQEDVDATIGFMDASPLRQAHHEAFAQGTEKVTYYHPVFDNRVALLTMDDSIAAWAKLYSNAETVTIMLKAEEISNLFLYSVREKLIIDMPKPLPRDIVATNMLYRLLTMDDNNAFDGLIEVKDDSQEYTARTGDLMHNLQVTKIVNLIETIVLHCDQKLTEAKALLKEDEDGSGTGEMQ